MPEAVAPNSAIWWSFIALAALAAGLAAFVVSQIEMVVDTKGDLSFWGFPVMFSTILGCCCALGVAIVGMLVLIVTRTMWLPAGDAARSLFVGGAVMGISLIVVVTVYVALVGPSFDFGWPPFGLATGIAAALVGGGAAGLAVWNEHRNARRWHLVSDAEAIGDPPASLT